MADYNLHGRWYQGNFEINISMGAHGEFNIKAVSAELQTHWQAGYGEVFQSGKFTIHLVHTDDNGNVDHEGDLSGYVTADQREMRIENGVVWQRR